MLLNKLCLDNFRSYGKKEFKFDNGITLVVGPNTAGKSNLLEALFLLAFGTSPRAGLDREMIKTGEKLGFVRGFFLEDGEKELEVVLTATGKRFRVNGVGRRLSDFSSHFHVVLFSPHDLNLVSGRPDLRRRFVDLALGSVDQDYARAFREYDKIRKRRNRLLERINQSRGEDEELGFWDAKLLEHGVLLQDKRKAFFDEVNREVSTDGFLLKYSPSGLTAERLREYRPREIAAETTLIGPHRDDFSFFYGDKDLSAYGSRGEQRKAVLTLKKAELEFVQDKTGERPLLLLDDIFSELDKDNRSRVFDLIGGSLQTIITTTDLRNVPQGLNKDFKTIEL